MIEFLMLAIAFGEFLGLVLPVAKELVVTAAAGTGGYCAYRGLKIWREQLYASRAHDIAFRALKSLLEVRDAFKLLRGMAIGPGELVNASKVYIGEEGVNPPAGEVSLIALSIRHKALQAKLSNLDAHLLDPRRFQVIWLTRFVGYT